VAYVIGFFVMLAVLGFHPDGTPHKATPAKPAASATQVRAPPGL
jgi:hypothetical protein